MTDDEQEMLIECAYLARRAKHDAYMADIDADTLRILSKPMPRNFEELVVSTAHARLERRPLEVAPAKKPGIIRRIISAIVPWR